MVTVDQIKQTLKGWPNEVVEEWILYFANDIGWPPAEPLGADRWGGILGNRPLSWWAQITWTEQTVDCSFDSLSNSTKQRVNQIAAQVNDGTADKTTLRRFNHPFKYIMDNGTFPNAMVAMNAPDGLSFIDGHHRMAAFTGLQKMPPVHFEKLGLTKPSVEQAVWIGVHPQGEMPLA